MTQREPESDRPPAEQIQLCDLSFGSRWLAESAAGPWQDKLRELAQAFDAAAAGLPANNRALVVLSRIERGPRPPRRRPASGRANGLLHAQRASLCECRSENTGSWQKSATPAMLDCDLDEAPSNRAWTQAEAPPSLLPAKRSAVWPSMTASPRAGIAIKNGHGGSGRLEDVTHVVRRLATISAMSDRHMGFSELALAQLPANAPSRRYSG